MYIYYTYLQLVMYEQRRHRDGKNKINISGRKTTWVAGLGGLWEYTNMYAKTKWMKGSCPVKALVGESQVGSRTVSDVPGSRSRRREGSDRKEPGMLWGLVGDSCGGNWKGCLIKKEGGRGPCRTYSPWKGIRLCFKNIFFGGDKMAGY